MLLNINKFFFWIAYDTLYFMYIFYIKIKFKVLRQMVAKIGDFDSEYDSEEKQHELVAKCVELHTNMLE